MLRLSDPIFRITLSESRDLGYRIVGRVMMLVDVRNVFKKIEELIRDDFFN
jgi:uncharacterized membrane protein